MLPIHRVLCPTDFSDASRHALDEAAKLATHFGAELLVLNVVPALPALESRQELPIEAYGEALRKEAEAKLAACTASLSEKARPRPMVRQGDAAATIMLVADDEKVDVIVIATHGMKGWHHFVFGSVTEKVVRLAHCPVLTLRPPKRVD